MCRGANIDPAEFEKEEFKELCIRPLVKKFARCKSNSVAVRKLLREYKRVIEVSNLFGIDVKISKYYRYLKGRRITAYNLLVQVDKPQEVTGRGLFSEDSDEETYYELEVAGCGSLSDLSDEETFYDESEEEDKTETVSVPNSVTNFVDLTVEEEESSVESLEESSTGNRDSVVEGATQDDRALRLGTGLFNIIDRHYGDLSHIRLVHFDLTFDTQSGTFVSKEYVQEVLAVSSGVIRARTYYT